jgi:eukaryotic-like serine/threonine-protein kinase
LMARGVDAGIDLEDAGAETDQIATVKAPPRRWLPIGATAVISAAMAAALLLTIGRPRGNDRAQTVRFSMQMPEGWTIFRNLNNRPTFEISPDGQQLAVVLTRNAERSIFLRRLDETTFRRLSGTLGATNVFWAPDSERLGFALQGVTFRKTDLNGTGSQQIAAIPDGNPFAIWGTQDEIISGRTAGTLLRWSLANPVPTPIGELPKDVSGQFPLTWLPNGHIMYGDIHPEFRAVMVRSSSAEPRPLTSYGGAGFYSAPGFAARYSAGHLLMTSNDASGRSAVTAQPIDLDTLTLSGEIVVLAPDANPAFSASDNGVLVTAPGLLLDDRFVWLDARGEAQSTLSTGTELRRPTNFDLSADGSSLVFQQAGPNNPLVVHDVTRGVTTALAVKGTDPVWSADGKQIAFAIVSGPDRGIHVVPAFGGASRLIHTQAEVVYLDDWSRDGKWLAGHVNIAGHGILIPTSSNAKPIEFEQGGLAVDETAFSPDVRWLAYNGGQGQGVNVYVTPVPPTGERWQISVSGGAQPRWRADGKALYFLSLSGTMMTVDFQAVPGGAPKISAPRALFDAGLQVTPALDQYRVNADGTRFLVRRSDPGASAASNQLDVIVNWPGLLRK